MPPRLLLLGIFAAALPSFAQQTLDGRWEGAVVHRGARMKVSIELRAEGEVLKAWVSIPDQYALGLSAKAERPAPGKVRIELPYGPKPQVFDGQLAGGKLRGTYSGSDGENDIAAEFSLARVKERAAPYGREEVRFQNGDVALAGTLFVPARKGPHPAVLLFHGSGPQTRESYLAFFADWFARRGIAALIYDKRGTGASGGQVWFRVGDRFDDLAADGIAGINFLRSRGEIDAARIGVWGFSQGAWLAPLAATRTDGIAFLIAVSGGGVTPAEQELYDDEVKLQARGFARNQIEEALTLLRMADDVIRGRVEWSVFAAAREKAQREPWFAHLDRFPLVFPEEHPAWRAGSGGLDFDPRPIWRAIAAPVLVIYGERDELTPAVESAQRVRGALEQAGNRDFRIEILPGADHGMWVKSRSQSRWDWDRPAPGWLETMSRWVLMKVRK